jgi:hypothetical protein
LAASKNEGRKRRNLWRKFKKVMLGLAMAMYERRRLFFFKKKKTYLLVI